MSHSTRSQPRFGSACTTHGFTVRVQPEYVPDHSDPSERRFVFTYQITIENTSGQPAQLVSRHWIITNANGTTHEVVGDGVVGEQPHLAPGASHTYSSFCPLDTPWGTMEGSFHMIADSGEAFSITVGRFFLVTPESTK